MFNFKSNMILMPFIKIGQKKLYKSIILTIFLLKSLCYWDLLLCFSNSTKCMI
jgi:hypothetical protein